MYLTLVWSFPCCRSQKLDVFCLKMVRLQCFPGTFVTWFCSLIKKSVVAVFVQTRNLRFNLLRPRRRQVYCKGCYSRYIKDEEKSRPLTRMAPNTGAAARLLLRQKQSQRGMIRPSPPAAATASAAASLRVDYTGAGGINCGRCCHDKCLFFSQKTRSIGWRI